MIVFGVFELNMKLLIFFWNNVLFRRFVLLKYYLSDKLNELDLNGLRVGLLVEFVRVVVLNVKCGESCESVGCVIVLFVLKCKYILLVNLVFKFKLGKIFV